MILPIDKAEEMKRTYVCATCWGHLITFQMGDQHGVLEIKCANPECNLRGYVTKEWVKQRRAIDAADKIEAANNLRDVLPGLNKPPRDEQTILSELGF